MKHHLPTIALSLLLTVGCVSDTVVYHSDEPLNEAVLQRISDDVDKHCGVPIVWVQVKIPDEQIHLLREEVEKPRDYFEVSKKIMSEEHKKAVTTILFDSDASDFVGRYYGFAPAVKMIYVRWGRMPGAIRLRNILMHELGHRYTLDHDDDPENTMYYAASSSIEGEFTDEQWETVCEHYIDQTAIRWRKVLDEINQE